MVDNSETPPYTWTTYPERLQAAGISWQVYQEVDNYDDNPLAWFSQYQQAAKSSPLYKRGISVQSSLLDRFAEDVATRRLPQVSWIIGPDYSTEHPPYLPAAGATFMWDLISVLRDNPDVWRKTALFVTYDENDGYFDHVLPKAAPPGTPGEYISRLPAAGGIAGPIGPGFRVPMIVVSPWADFPDLASPDALPTPAKPANINQEQAECFVAPGGSGSPPPAPPAAIGQTAPAQEPGTRPRRGRGRPLSRAGLLRSGPP